MHFFSRLPIITRIEVHQRSWLLHVPLEANIYRPWSHWCISRMFQKRLAQQSRWWGVTGRMIVWPLLHKTCFRQWSLTTANGQVARESVDPNGWSQIWGQCQTSAAATRSLPRFNITLSTRWSSDSAGISLVHCHPFLVHVWLLFLFAGSGFRNWFSLFVSL